MIIHPPESITNNGYTIVSSRIELDKVRNDFPEYLWYKVPEQNTSFLSIRGDSFLVSILPIAMHLGENIEVRGAVSPKLAYHLKEYQFLLNFFMPREVQPIKIQYRQLSALDKKPSGVSCTFSGGIDSFFNVMQHSPQNQPIPDYQLSHALFIDGFDIVLTDEQKYDRLFARYQTVLHGLGIELVPIQTNVLNFILPWLKYARFHTSILAGCGLILSGLFKRFMILNSRDYYQLQITTTGANPLNDRLLSTETMDIMHIGATYRRVEKVKAISDWEPAQDHLRVCAHHNPNQQHLNCSRCEKCTRTMIPIYALGKMDQFSTFSKPFKSNWDLLWWARKFDPRLENYSPEILVFVRKYRPKLLPWLYLAAFLGTLRYWFIKSIPEFIKNWLRKYGYFNDPLQSENVFEDPDIIELINASTTYKNETVHYHQSSIQLNNKNK